MEAPGARAWIGLLLGLGLCGTGLAYLAYYYVVADLGAVAASSVTYIPPVVALVVGAILVCDDPLSYIVMMPIPLGVATLAVRAVQP